jgi:hypothetical protein
MPNASKLVAYNWPKTSYVPKPLAPMKNMDIGVYEQHDPANNETKSGIISSTMHPAIYKESKGFIQIQLHCIFDHWKRMGAIE